jgi:hypothetical protein
MAAIHMDFPEAADDAEQADQYGARACAILAIPNPR